MILVANNSLVAACATPVQSAADSSAISICLVDFMLSCASSAAGTPCLHQRMLKTIILDEHVLAEQKQTHAFT